MMRRRTGGDPRHSCVEGITPEMASPSTDHPAQLEAATSHNEATDQATMTYQIQKPRPLTPQTGPPEAARRWEAYFAGEMLDRPIVCVTAPRHGPLPPWAVPLSSKSLRHMDEVIDERSPAPSHLLCRRSDPELLPQLRPRRDRGLHRGRIRLSEDSAETNWSVPYVGDWTKPYRCA